MGNKEFGQLLKKLREANGFTQQKVADTLSLSGRSIVAGWESGKSEPDALSFIRLCFFYGLYDFSYFISDSQSVKRSEMQIMLLALFDKLNDEGRQLLLDTADAFVASGKYKKIDQLGLGKEA